MSNKNLWDALDAELRVLEAEVSGSWGDILAGQCTDEKERRKLIDHHRQCQLAVQAKVQAIVSLR